MRNTIIALDLDDTLLNDEEKISKKNILALKKVQDLGATIVISTNRNYASTLTYAKQINADYGCSQGGTIIFDNHGKVIFSNPILQTETIKFVETFSPLTNEIFVDSIDGIYGIENNFSKKWTIHPTKIDDLKNITAYKFLMRNAKNCHPTLENFCKKNGYIFSGVRRQNYLMITRATSDKYYALQKLMQKLKKEKLVVFGDDFNDLMSIQNATCGVAMANSRPEVLAQAKYKTKSNNEDGVAYFLEKFLL